MAADNNGSCKHSTVVDSSPHSSSFPQCHSRRMSDYKEELGRQDAQSAALQQKPAALRLFMDDDEAKHAHHTYTTSPLPATISTATGRLVRLIDSVAVQEYAGIKCDDGWRQGGGRRLANERIVVGKVSHLFGLAAQSLAHHHYRMSSLSSPAGSLLPPTPITMSADGDVIAQVGSAGARARRQRRCRR